MGKVQHDSGVMYHSYAIQQHCLNCRGYTCRRML